MAAERALRGVSFDNRLPVSFVVMRRKSRCLWEETIFLGKGSGMGGANGGVNLGGLKAPQKCPFVALAVEGWKRSISGAVCAG